MKRQALRHPKTERLALSLDIPLYGAWGLLEGLWHFTAEYAPTGAIGKFSNQDIANKLTWGKDPNELVNTLIACGFLETSGCCENHRLSIHDWKDHLQDSTSKYLKRNNLQVSVKCLDMSGKCPEMSRHVSPTYTYTDTNTRPIPDQNLAPPDIPDGGFSKVGFDDPLLEADSPIDPLTLAIERLGTPRTMQSGNFWHFKVQPEMAAFGKDELTRLLNEQADRGVANWAQAIANIKAATNQRSFKKENSNGSHNSTGRVAPPPGKYIDRRRKA